MPVMYGANVKKEAAITNNNAEKQWYMPHLVLYSYESVTYEY